MSGLENEVNKMKRKNFHYEAQIQMDYAIKTTGIE